MVYKSELEFCQRCPRVFLGLSKQSRQVCVCLCMCARARARECVRLCVRACVRERACGSQMYCSEYLSVKVPNCITNPVITPRILKIYLGRLKDRLWDTFF